MLMLMFLLEFSLWFRVRTLLALRFYSFFIFQIVIITTLIQSLPISLRLHHNVFSSLPNNLPVSEANPKRSIINIMDEEEGFCLEKAQIVTHYHGSHYQPPTEKPHELLIELSSISQPELPIKVLMEDSQEKYVALLKGSELINQQIREQWCQGLLSYIPHNRIIMNNVQHRKDAAFSRNNLVFDSQFECGNLDLAVKVKFNEYNLYVRPDTNTTGNFQWFYFKVVNTRKDQTIKFNIKNLSRLNQMYNQGLTPYFASDRATNGLWRPLHPQINKVGMAEEENYQQYCLSFCYTFVQDGELVSFATNPPYSIDRLLKLLLPFKIQNLCTSALNFNVPRVSFLSSKKAGINSVGLAIARQHPGEAVGSWMMEGFLMELAQRELGDVCWYIVPMVNVDGVYLGNSRTGVAGYDYNRLYNIEEPSAVNRDKLTPEVVAIANLAKRLKKKYGKKFKMFLDFHGHSSRPNIFTYGPPYGVRGTEEFLQARLFPQIIGQKTSLFKGADCSYNIPPIKRNTARSIIFNRIKIPYCYTIQSSFGLADGRQIYSEDLITVGRKIAESSLEFMEYLDKKPELQTTVSKYLIERIKNHMNEPEKIEKGQSDSSDGEIQRESPKTRDIIASNTTGSALDHKQAQKLMAHKDKIVHRQTFSKGGYLIRTKLIDETKHSIDGCKKIPLSTRYRVTTQSFRFAPHNKSKQVISIKPMTKFVPRLQINTKNERPSKPNITNPQALRPVKTPESLRSNLSAMILNNLDYSINQSIDKFRTNVKATNQQLSPQRKNRTHSKVALLQQLSKNNKNKVGRQMLIINQF